MPVPPTVYHPPFNVTRASHAVLTVKDLAASRAFYVDLLGFIVSDEDASTLYLRGVAEACHHSLVLKETAEPARCERVGLRVYTEEDLDQAKSWFESQNRPVHWADAPYQGRTLHIEDPVGVPLEICAAMTAMPRMIISFHAHHGAIPQRLDHVQILTPHVQRACDFYMSMGFRLSEYMAPEGSEELLFVFLQRKGNPHDVVFAHQAGPRLHHCAFAIGDSSQLFTLCDLVAEAGLAANVEFGPGRHGPGHALFVYLRDPDGHRLEFFTTHYPAFDIENEPVRWDVTKVAQHSWQLPPREQWFTEASPFVGADVEKLGDGREPPSLEKFLRQRG